MVKKFLMFGFLMALFVPSMVEAAQPAPKGEVTIHININKLRMQVLDDGQLFKEFPVAVGKPSTPSPVGEFRVVNKGRHEGAAYGTRWMGLNVPWGTYGIHGTNNPRSIGTAASGGCFRMFNSHVEELFPWVQVGTKVFVSGWTPAFKGFNRPLKRRTFGQDVAIFQLRINKTGFGVGAADGRFGTSTDLGVRLFEAYHMLPVDGEADKVVLQRLNKYFEKK